LLNRAQPMIEQAQSLYAEAEPLIEEAKKEWQTVGPAAQILIDVISHHVDKGRSPAEAAEAVRTALDGSIKTLAQDHWMDREISCVTVFGGTGFVGRRVARHLRRSGATVRIASRPPRRAEGDSLAHIPAKAPDQPSREAAVMVAPDDAFLTTILRLLRSLPAYPMLGDGRTRLQPAYADDVAAAIAEVVRESKKPYPIYELAGPRVYSYEELLRTIARSAGLRP